MPRYRRIRRQTRGKRGVKKSETFIGISGSGSAPTTFEVLVTEGGARTLDGSAQTFADHRTTDETVNVGDVVKYVNLSIACAPRTVDAASIGWLEWAFVCHKEVDPDPPITNLGTETLGVVCTRMFGGDCIYTGCVPIGLNVPNCHTPMLKIPVSKSTIHRGDQWHLYTYYRTQFATETGTDTVKQVLSFNYKAYGN